MKPLLLAGSVAFALAALMPVGGMSARADEAAPAPQAGDQVFEIHDNADTAPVNYRSNEDPRYDTKKQRDAEMFAEQYEQKRAAEALKQKNMMDRLNTLSPSDDRTISGAGVTAAGFPSNTHY